MLACESKDKEIAELKESLAQQQERDSILQESPITHSPLIFSQSVDIFDGIVEEYEKDVDDSLMPAGQMMLPAPCHTSSPKSTVELMETEHLEIFKPPGTPPAQKRRAVEVEEEEDMPQEPVKAKDERPLAKKRSPQRPIGPGWKVKPTDLSFSNLNINKTQVYQPAKNPKKQPFKTRTIDEMFNKNTSPPKRKPLTAIINKELEVIQIEDEDEEDKKENGQENKCPKKNKQTTPSPPPIKKPLDVITTTRAEWKELNRSFDEFCEECRDYFKSNPPKWPSVKAKEAKIRECAAHIAKKYKGHHTPPGYWNVGFKDDELPDQMKTQEYVKNG